MTVDEQIKELQLQKLKRELEAMPKSKLSFDALSKLVVPLLALATAGYAFWIGLPKAQLDLLNAQRNVVESERKLADAERKLGDVATRREALLAEIERLRATVENIQLENKNTATSLSNIRLAATDAKTRDEIDKALVRVERVETSLAAAGEKLSVAATTASDIGRKSAQFERYRVDIFHCVEAGERAKARAEAAFALAQGRKGWRLRALSVEDNRKSGYGIHDDRIRFNADEQAVADAMRTEIRTALGVELFPNQITFPTPGYISVFFCAGQ